MSNNKNWADSTAIAIFIVSAIILGCFWPLSCGFITMGAAPLVGGILVASAIVFITLMVIEIRNGNLFGATLNGVFGILLALAPGLAFLAQFAGSGMGVEVDPRVIGWYLMYVGPVLLIVGVAAGTHFWHMAIIFWALGVDVFMLGLVFAGVGPHSWMAPLGWILFGTGVYFLYMATASFLGGMFRRPVLPVGGPLFRVQ